MFSGKALGAFGDKIDVRTVAENFAGSANRVAEALDAGDPSGAKVRTVHEQGVKLDAAEPAASAASAS